MWQDCVLAEGSLVQRGNGCCLSGLSGLRCRQTRKSRARPLTGRGHFLNQKRSALLATPQSECTQCTNQKQTGRRKRYNACRTARTTRIGHSQTITNLRQNVLSLLAGTRIRPNGVCEVVKERRRNACCSLAPHLAAIVRGAVVAPGTAPPESGRVCSGAADGQKTNHSNRFGEFHYFPHTS